MINAFLNFIRRGLDVVIDSMSNKRPLMYEVKIWVTSTYSHQSTLLLGA
ncbi:MULTISPECIES: hypothetical protein [unclassified Pseudoalteromonas]|nr:MULTISPECIES: hypothetical protein [unclassified Pseudoalteromonas]MBH0049074.1 hypothetical protein [Pseudoalteromonas sp. SWYJZ19]